MIEDIIKTKRISNNSNISDTEVRGLFENEIIPSLDENDLHMAANSIWIECWQVDSHICFATDKGGFNSSLGAVKI